MKDDTTIAALHQAGSIIDPLTEIAREGARQMLAAALRAEAASFAAQFAQERLPDGRQRIVRHGTGPERTIQTGIGPIAVRRQKVRDRATGALAEKKIRFTSTILPRWARRSRSLDALLPVLYLRGVPTGNFQEALTALLGADAPNLSPGVISRLTTGWQEDYDRWQRRDLSARRYVYIWADGVYLQARMEPQRGEILDALSVRKGERSAISAARSSGRDLTELSWNFLASSGFASESPRAPAPALPVSRWRSSSSNQHRPGGGPSTHPTSSRWSVPARYSRTASSSNDPTDQRVVISKSRDTPIHRS